MDANHPFAHGPPLSNSATLTGSARTEFAPDPASSFSSSNSTTMAVTCGDIPRVICSVLIPPVGVYFQVGCTKDLAINVLLTVLGYVSLSAFLLVVLYTGISLASLCTM